MRSDARSRFSPPLVFFMAFLFSLFDSSPCEECVGMRFYEILLFIATRTSHVVIVVVIVVIVFRREYNGICNESNDRKRHGTFVGESISA